MTHTNSVSKFCRDLSGTLIAPGYWIFAAAMDISTKYRSNKLGFMWIILSSVVFVVVLGQLYHQLFKVDLWVYSIHLYGGLILWNFLSIVISESSNIVRSSDTILSTSTSINPIHIVLRVEAKHLLVLLHNIIPWLALVVFSDLSLSAFWWAQVLFGLCLLILFVFSSSLIAMYLGAWLPDTAELLGALFRIGFLATPIIWMRDRVTVLDSTKDGLRYYVEFNPFFHALEIVRAPTLGNSSSLSIIIILSFTVFNLILASFLYNGFRKKMESFL